MVKMSRLGTSAPGWGLVVLLGIILMAGWTQAQTAGPVKAGDNSAARQAPGRDGVDPQYLIFWCGNKGAPDLLDRVGATGDGKSRQLGFGLAMRTFDDEKVLPARIHEAFQAARKYNLAVALSFDSHNFWQSRADLWNWFDPQRPGYNPANKNNVEWYDWKGTPNKARYLNWGKAERLAPHMCYTSPAIRQEITRIVSTVIAPAINSELDQLKREGREYLFAGILAGAEITIDDYTHTDPEIAKLMEQEGAPRVRLGYCALTQSGFSENNPPEDIRLALAAVDQEFVCFWCKQFVVAGISPTRVYTHIAAPFVQETTTGPIWDAFNEYSRVGWTTYPVRFLADDFDALYNELKEHGYPSWGGVEANAGFPLGKPTVRWEEYLARHFNHGAKLVGINYGASSDKLTNLLRDSAYSPDAIAAYKKFLAGEPLQGSPPRHETGSAGGEPPARLRQKMEQLHAGVEKFQQAGGDPSPIQQIMQEFHPLMQEGKYREAEAVLDRALEVLKQKASPTYKGPPSY